MSLAQRMKLLHHTSGRCLESAASFDRYTTIRNFFKQCRPVHTTPRLTFSVTERYSWGNYNARISVGLSQNALHVRNFSQSSRFYEENKQRESARSDPNDDVNIRTGPGDANKSQSTHEPDDGRESRGLPNLDNYPPFFRRLAMSLPHLHRPTKDDFLNVANGFWQRARVRFRWVTIRSFRKYNADDISAFVTWFFMSQTLWLLVGT